MSERVESTLDGLRVIPCPGCGTLIPPLAPDDRCEWCSGVASGAPTAPPDDAGASAATAAMRLTHPPAGRGDEDARRVIDSVRADVETAIGVPRVSEIIRMVQPVRYQQVPPAILEAAAYRGTWVHQWIERHAPRGWALPEDADQPPQYAREYVVSAAQWPDMALPWRPVAYELRLGLDWATGTADVIEAIPERRALRVVDWKTSTRTYPVHRLQVVLYTRLLAEHLARIEGASGWTVDDPVIVRLSREGRQPRAVEVEYAPEAAEGDHAVAAALTTIWGYRWRTDPDFRRDVLAEDDADGGSR